MALSICSLVLVTCIGACDVDADFAASNILAISVSFPGAFIFWLVLCTSVYPVFPPSINMCEFWLRFYLFCRGILRVFFGFSREF